MKALPLAIHGTSHQRVELEQEALYQAFPNARYWDMRAEALTKALLPTLTDEQQDELAAYVDALPDDITSFGVYEALMQWTETHTQPVAVSWTSSASVEVR